VIGKASWQEKSDQTLPSIHVLFWVTQKLPSGDLRKRFGEFFGISNYESFHDIKRINTDLWSQKIMFKTSKRERNCHPSINNGYAAR
jgi:hypothetical protein